MAKEKKLGRPKGKEKEPVNVLMPRPTAKELRRKVDKKKKISISSLVCEALEKTYGI